MSYSAGNGRAPLDRFDVFAPHAAGVVVRIDGQDHEMIKALDLPGHSPRGLEPAPEYASGEHSPMGWWTLPDEAAESVPSTTVRYGYILSKVLDPGTPEERTIESAVLPDPRSMRQPQGVHELSCTYDPADFEWTDHDWGGADLEDTVLYEMHIGTFTPEGTFEAAIQHLDALAERLRSAPVSGPFDPQHAVIIASHLDAPEPVLPPSIVPPLTADEYTSLVVHAAVDAENDEH